MLKKAGLIGVLLMAVVGTSVFAQTPSPRIVHYSINVPYKLRMGDYMLPAGNYVLEQVMQSDPNLYYLHPMNLTHGPIAAIRTTRISYNGRIHQPEGTKILIKEDNESSGDSLPVLKGFVLGGEDGFEVISVTPGKNSSLVRVHS
jgi:hypothetical protein